MNLLSRKEHPDGLKILIAAAVSGNTTEIVEDKSLSFCGAVLEVKEHNTTFQLRANSAVLYLLRLTSQQQLQGSDVEAWLEWEATQLQPVLVPYLVSVAGGREDKSLREALDALLSTLAGSAILTTKDVNAATIVLFSSLLPLSSEPITRSFLESCHPKVISFIDSFKEKPQFKDCVSSWCGGGSLKNWVVQTPQPFSQLHSTLALLKVSSTSPPSLTTAEQSKPAKALVTEAQVKEARLSWEKPGITSTKPRVRQVPVLPVKGESNILISSALPYVNNVPHLGNIIGCVLSADCFSRFCRLRGDNVFYVCGTDEYGTATETKAIAEGLTPQQICDKYHAIHSSVYKWFNIDFDHFGRTTTPEQTKIAQDIFKDLDRNGKIFEEPVEQLYCGKCERFLADRFVEGGCPHPGCGYLDARGDQCDDCGKLINAMELNDPRCKLCSSLPSVKSSTHLFLDLPIIEPDLLSWLPTSAPQWSSNAQVICESWLRDGLKRRCITRDLKWGTPVPKDGFKDKVFYVWFDAPIGYVSMTACYTEKWELWWRNPDEVKYYEFMAKDNVPFHSVVFPSTQLGTGRTWTKVSHLVATEYLNYEDGKFSKSRGVGVFGDQAMETGIPSDIWRFYLLYMRPEGQDTAFSWVDLQTKTNSELLNNLGNFVHRALSFVYKFFDGKIPDNKPVEGDFQLMAAVNQELSQYISALASNRQRDALRCMLAITRLGNQYIQENEPFKLVKPNRPVEDHERGATVIAVAANMVALVGIILEPYMPDTAANIRDFLGNPACLRCLPSAFSCFLPPGHTIKEPRPLITQLDDETIKHLSTKFGGQASAQKADPAEVARIQALVDQQAIKVRQLKEGGSASKEKISGEVTTLLKLKGELAAAQGVDPNASGKDKKKGKKEGGGKGGGKGEKAASLGKAAGVKNNVNSSPPANIVVDEKEVGRIQALVTEQGDKVRAVKAQEGVSKDVVNQEVAKLLQLKRELAVAQGLDPDAPTKDKKKKKN